MSTTVATVFDSTTIVVVDKTYFGKLETEFAKFLFENERLRKIEQEFNTLQLTYATTFNELDALKWDSNKEINRLNNEISAITEERDGFDRLKWEADKEIAGLNDQIFAITEERDALQYELDTLKWEADKEITGLNNQISTITEERDCLQNDLDTLKQDSNKEIENLKDDVRYITEERDCLQYFKWEADKEINRLNNEVLTISEERDVLQNELDTLKQDSNKEIENLNEQLYAISEERDALQNKFDNQLDQYNALEILNNNNEAELSQLQNEYDRVYNERQCALMSLKRHRQYLLIIFAALFTILIVL